MSDGGANAMRGVELLADRVAALPSAIASAISDPLPSAVTLLPGPFAVTGAGGSEGPARILSDRLARAGIASRFVPLSSFVASSPPVTSDDRLVIVSQGLSPNARLALAHRHRVARCVVLTATRPERGGSDKARVLADAADEGHLVITHGPSHEGELLVRVLGPALATLVALRLAAAIVGDRLELPDLPTAISRAFDRAPAGELDDDAVTALVVAGDGGATSHGLRWKVLEALDRGDPPVWDVLQFAHGPLQQYFERSATLITLERTEAHHAELFERLQSVVPSRHRILRLKATLAEPLAWFEHDAMLNAIVIRELRRSPRDLVQWPGKGQDQPLYAIDRPLEE